MSAEEFCLSLCRDGEPPPRRAQPFRSNIHASATNMQRGARQNHRSRGGHVQLYNDFGRKSEGVMLRACLISLIAGAPSGALAADYWRPVSQKFNFNSEHQYTAQELERRQFAVRIEERGDVAYVSRCSYARSAGELTCDRYEMDKVVRNPYRGDKKYYLFRAQFDVQLFRDLSFVENNGYGGIAYGRCELVAP